MLAAAFALMINTTPINLQCDGIVDVGSRQLVARAAVEMNGELVRVQAPSYLFATVTGRPQDYWRDLRDVVITDREICGTQKPNMVSRMNVILNRMTGSIQIDVLDPIGGNASFTGDCKVAATTPLF